ncbi:MAG TPA: acyl-CoA thioesterase [Planctomycetaceae bacterium]|nr:acyl-CoA thioesterase [Planctomycetaceae bacterium]
MNWFVYHVVSGQAFFTGVILLIIAALAAGDSRAVFKRMQFLAVFVGIVAIVVSSTPLSYPVGIAATAVTLAWILLRNRMPWRNWVQPAFVAVWVLAGLAEVPYHIMPSVNSAVGRSLGIIGDSVTAGIGEDETAETWPTLLAREHNLEIQDISHVGETAASALKRAMSQSLDASVVMIEIGGNDILGTTTSTQFERDLDALLTFLTSADRQIVMFELPLPPFFHEYGRAQRAMAAKHHVVLIPKRVFLSVISERQATLDTIHLSQSGHQRMADCVWSVVRSAFDAKTPQ